MDYDRRVNLARCAIAAILEKLEADTGALVERIEVRDTDVTSVDSERPEIKRSVVIEMRRQPGTHWIDGDRLG